MSSHARDSSVILGVDVGGTFTDVVAVEAGGFVTAKVPTTPRDQSEGVMAAIGATHIPAGEVEALAHGMTVGTNALLERRGARTALVTTDGFRDLIEIGRQNRPALYDLTKHRPAPLVPRELRFAVAERMGREGVVRPLDASRLAGIIGELAENAVEAVAVCLLFSFAYPEHEQRVATAIRAALPDVHVSVSSEVVPEFREFERFSTTVADAYLGPRIASYLDNLAAKTSEAGFPAPMVMQSSGGVIDIEDAAEHAAACVLSGPAAGVVGGAVVAQMSGVEDALTFDMGGTSTDVAAIVGGRVQTSTESIVGGIPIKLPMVDVHSVSAGGGSIAWVDEGGALRVGPRSAGADPGPAAYGRGGDEPTVTDADVALGFISDGARLGGEIVLDAGLSEKALARLGGKAGMDTIEMARGIVDVANTEMARALRLISIERGLDPREFALVAFGGAGPLHACALAEELGINAVLVPKAGGVLSALGLAISDQRRDYVRPFLSGLSEADRDGIERVFAEMESQARSDLADSKVRRHMDLRYRGQSYELDVDAHELERLADHFNSAHRQRYGYHMETEAVEIVNLRVEATVARLRPRFEEAPVDDGSKSASRKALLGGQWVETPVFARDLMGRSSRVEGPAIVEFAEATCVVPSSWRGEIDNAGTLVLERNHA